MQANLNPYGQYRQQKNTIIESADRVTLISMLLEGAINYNKKALIAVEQKDQKSALEFVDYGVKIILHLYSCLNFDEGGEVAERLGTLYNYACDQYVLFQKKPDTSKELESINRILAIVLDGWKQLPKG